MQAQVNCLVTEPMANRVSGSTAAPVLERTLAVPLGQDDLALAHDRQGQPGITLVADLGRDVGVDGLEVEGLGRVGQRARAGSRRDLTDSWTASTVTSSTGTLPPGFSRICHMAGIKAATSTSVAVIPVLLRWDLLSSNIGAALGGGIQVTDNTPTGEAVDSCDERRDEESPDRVPTIRVPGLVPS